MDESIIPIIILGAIVLFSIILVLSSRSRIWRIYSKYLKVDNSKNITGEKLAFYMQRVLGYYDIQLSLTPGKLTDAYVSGKHKYLLLSEEVAKTASLASIAIVAHEFGHAIQDHQGDILFRLTKILKVITRLTSKLIVPTIIAGVILILFDYYTTIAHTLLIIGASILVAVILLKVLTIPMERDASRRAMKFLREYNIVTRDEMDKVFKLLAIASQTYIVALFDDLLIVKLVRKHKAKARMLDRR